MSYPKRTPQTKERALEVVVAESHFRGSGKTISTSHAIQKPYAPAERTENADLNHIRGSRLTTPVRLDWRPLPDED
jgi:hypothetical protein